jgi:hypothetical protein
VQEVSEDHQLQVAMKIRRVETTQHTPCGERDGQGPPCTLPVTHLGWHMACDSDGNELAYWPQRVKD